MKIKEKVLIKCSRFTDRKHALKVAVDVTLAEVCKVIDAEFNLIDEQMDFFENTLINLGVDKMLITPIQVSERARENLKQKLGIK